MRLCHTTTVFTETCTGTIVEIHVHKIQDLWSYEQPYSTEQFCAIKPFVTQCIRASVLMGDCVLREGVKNKTKKVKGPTGYNI